MPPSHPAFALALVVALSAGCATYSERTALGRESAAAGSYEAAAEAFDKALGVGERAKIPRRFGSETALILLERAMVSQAQGYYADAARDLEQADQNLEYLDLASDPVGALGKYLYSDSAAKYRASPVEKLALNSMNMLNYLAVGDLVGARVEAKRYTVMRDYLETNEVGGPHGTIGAYLAGFVFERLGDANEAIRYYDEALGDRELATLAAPAAALARRTAYRGKNMHSFLERHRSKREPGAGPDSGEILTVVALGRVPFKVPERIPVGAAIGYAGAYISGDPEVLGYAALKVLVYPELRQGASTFTSADVSIDGGSVPVELVSDFGAEITREYDDARPKIIAAALSRMIVRAGAAEGAREAGKQAGDAGAVIGWIAALVTEATLVAFDKPDTRSWTLLPARIFVSRTTVSSGVHTVDVDLQGFSSERRAVQVEVPPGGYAVVVVTPLR